MNEVDVSNLLKNGGVFHCDLLVYQRVLGCRGTTVDGSENAAPVAMEHILRYYI